MRRWILIVLAADFAHLIEKLLLVMEVDLSVLKLWCLVRILPTRHGHYHVRTLWQLGLADCTRATQIKLATRHLDIGKLCHT